MRRLLLAAVVLTAALAAQAVADTGPPLEITWHPDPERMHIDFAGRIVASKPCRRGRILHLSNRKLDGTVRNQGASYPTPRTGRFRGQAEFLYQGGNNSGDVAESGGTIEFKLTAQRTRPPKGRFHSYRCPRIVHTERVEIPPDPYAEP